MSEDTLYRSVKTDGIQRRLRQPTVTRNCSTLLTESEVSPGQRRRGTQLVLPPFQLPLRHGRGRARC